MARLSTTLVAALAATAVQVQAYPHKRQSTNGTTGTIQPYVAPGPNDSRGPCPMLNTIANHGYINHNGSNLERQDVFDALLNFVGIQESAVDLAFTNALILCEFQTGASCGTTLTNLTLLGLPHAFEHDHSFSRQDYNLNSQTGEFQNNLNFDSDVFETSLDVLDGSDHMTFQQMQQVRLERESLSLEADYSDWFVEQIPIQEFEAGFIFAVMGDFNQADYINETQVYVPWWKYWFTNESLPYELGWHPPNPPKDANYMLSVSSRILHATVTSTPSPLPTGAFDDTPPPATLPDQIATTTYKLPSNTPYVGPIGQTGAAAKRQASVTAAPGASTTLTWKNPYVETLLMEDVIMMQAYAQVTASAAASAAAVTSSTVA